MAFSTTYPTTLANLTAGNEPLSILDNNFTPLYNAMNLLNTYGNYYADSGAVNAYVISITAQQTISLAAGLPIQFKALNTNTGASTLNASATGIKNIVRQDGTSLQAGDISTSGMTCVQYDGTNYVLTSPYAATSGSIVVPVRQTVLSGGPLDANGLATTVTWGGATASSIVTMSTTVIATAANGFSSSGAVDAVGTGVSLSWSGLTVNGTMFLNATISGSSLATFSSTIANVYAWGSTPSSINNACTFNIQEMKGYRGNGTSIVPQLSWLAIGEVLVAGGTVSTITWYQPLGRYQSPFTSTLPGSSVSISFNSNIGTTFIDWPNFIIRCNSTDNGYAVGDMLVNAAANGGAVVVPFQVTWTRNTAGFATNNSAASFTTMPKAGGAATGLTLAKWDYAMAIQRSF